MSSDHVMNSDTARLLLKIAREHHFCIDDLDDWKQHLDLREFEDWLEMFLNAEGEHGRDIRLRLQAETPHSNRESANDNFDNGRALGSATYNPSLSTNPRRDRSGRSNTRRSDRPRL